MAKLTRFLFLISLLTIISTIGFGQTEPKKINIRSIEINKSGAFDTTSFRMNGTDSDNKNFEYFVGDSSALLGNIQYFNCVPCNPIKVFETDHFKGGLFIPVSINNTTTIKFIPTFTNSSLLYLNQRVLSRKKDFSVSGITRLEGRIEISINGNNIIEVDNDVVLTGGFEARFSKPFLSPSGKTATQFKGIKFTLTDDREVSE